MKNFGLLAGFLTLSSLALASTEPISEQLLGVSVNHQGITFQVPSNGCTKKEHFRFLVEERLEPLGPMLPAYEHHHYITVNRVILDDCEMFQPYGTEIPLTFEELGIHFGKFHVNNPIGGDKLTSGQ